MKEIVFMKNLKIVNGNILSDIEKEKYTPSEDELLKLQEELDKLQKQKFGDIPQELKEEEVIIEPEKRVLSYSSRNA